MADTPIARKQYPVGTTDVHTDLILPINTTKYEFLIIPDAGDLINFQMELTINGKSRKINFPEDSVEWPDGTRWPGMWAAHLNVGDKVSIKIINNNRAIMASANAKIV